MNELQAAIQRQIDKYGGLRAAARVLNVSAPYLGRLRDGTYDNPNSKLQKKLGVRRLVVFERTGEIS